MIQFHPYLGMFDVFKKHVFPILHLSTEIQLTSVTLHHDDVW